MGNTKVHFWPFLGPNSPLKIEISNFQKKYPYLSSILPNDPIKVRKKLKLKKKFEMGGGYPLNIGAAPINWVIG